MREGAQSIADPDVRQVIENELRLLDPSVRRSPAATDALLDLEFREFGSSGRVWDRESILGVLDEDDAPPPDVDEIRASRLGPDVVLLTYRTRTPARTALRSSVWRRQDGGPWRVYFHQGTIPAAVRSPEAAPQAATERRVGVRPQRLCGRELTAVCAMLNASPPRRPVSQGGTVVKMRLEVVAIPVSDVDAAKAFYVDQVGFGLDHDIRPPSGMRVVQMTPPGSSCSVVIGEGLPLGEPGTARGAQLVVDDIDAVRAALADRGVPISDVMQLGPEGAPGSRFAFFDDPDGNGWSLQEITRG